MTEAEFATWLVDVAHVYGWRCAHFRPARTERSWRTPVQGDGIGFPDCILIHRRRGQGMALELKREKGCRVTPEQAEWIASFVSTGWIAMVATPADRDQLLSLLSGERAEKTA